MASVIITAIQWYQPNGQGDSSHERREKVQVTDVKGRGGGGGHGVANNRKVSRNKHTYIVSGFTQRSQTSLLLIRLKC